MKIAFFYSGYLPGKKYGGPVTSLVNLIELIGDDSNVYVICLNHDLKSTAPYKGVHKGWNIVNKAKVLYLSDNELTKEKYRCILKKINPDCIYVSSIFSAKFNYSLYSLSKELNIPVLLAPRGELNKDALKVKYIKKWLYISFLRITKKLDNIYFQATSKEEKNDICSCLKVPRKRVLLLPNIPAVRTKKHNIEKKSGCLKMCFVGRIVENKNLFYALKLLHGLSESIIFDIYGSKENQDYWDKCEKLIGEISNNIKVSYMGTLAPMEMRNKYAEYDCLISPTLFENYGQAIVEAMMSDTPVIISKDTTPWNDINNYHAGFAISLNDTSEFKNAIKKIAIMDTSRYQVFLSNLDKYCKVKFNIQELKEKYLSAFNNIIK